MYKLEASWQGAGAMSYVPGGSPLLAEGFITDFDGLRHELASAPREKPGSLAAQLSGRLPAGLVRQLGSAPAPLRASERRQLLAALNELIEGESLLSVAASRGA